MKKNSTHHVGKLGLVLACCLSLTGSPVEASSGGLAAAHRLGSANGKALLPDAINAGHKYAASVNVVAEVVEGKVTDKSGEGIPGVTVMLKGTSIGTTTDIDGKYRLSVPDGTSGGTLVFSFVGYITQEVALGNQTVLDVQMEEDTQQLEEVVVVGYGEQKKATITGSVSTLEGKEIVQSPVTNVSNSLAGRMAGVTAVTRSGEPGADGSTIRIRGANTLGDNDALVVVDGIPGRSLDRIDPNTIESMTVLKDASAAIYGAQAANGVILITTKRGKVGKPEITINYDQGFGRPTRIPEMTNAAEYATLLNEIDAYRGRSPRYTDEEIQKFSDGSDPWNYPNTDWFGEVLKPWSGQNNANMQISGGSENLRYMVALGRRFQDGYYKNSATNYSQYDFRSNLDGKISDNVNIGFDIAGRQENRNYPTRGAGSIFWMVMRGKPHMHAYWPDGTPGPDIEYGDNPAVISTDATGYDRDKRYVLNTTMKLNVKIPWVEGLSFNGNAGLDKEFRHRKVFQTPWYLYNWDGQSYDADGNPILEKGKKGFSDPRLSQSMEDRQDILLNAMLNYNRTFGGVHNMGFMVGTERRSGNREYFSAFRRFYASTAIDQLFAGGDAEKDNFGSADQSARLNYFGRINYNYQEKYLMEMVWRYDGSYIFPEDKRYGFFPGVSLGWRLSEEDFIRNNFSFFDNLKLRSSWGQTGNDRIDEWQYMASYAYGRWDAPTWNRAYRNAPYIFGVDEENKSLYEALIPNRNVTWEVANQFNVGLETTVLNGKLFLEADYFNYRRSQILWWRNASIPTSTGLSLPRENIGKVANSGFEYNVMYNDAIGEFSYQLGVNGSYAKNRILFWDEAPGVPEYQLSTGKPMETELYYQAIGIFRDQAHVESMPHWDDAREGDVIFEDVNGDGVIDANDRVRSDLNTLPRFTGGMTLNMQYKGFDLSILFQGAAQAIRYVNTPSGEWGNFQREFYENRWTEENPNAEYPRTFNRSEEYWRNQRNTLWMQRTDYVRLKNLQLGYSLPEGLTSRIGMQRVRAYVGGFNLLTYSPGVKDFDPESDNEGGTNYPLQKVVNTGVMITF
jgi:TonB-linked SusC/RagA family outer membrane protein